MYSYMWSIFYGNGPRMKKGYFNVKLPVNHQNEYSPVVNNRPPPKPMFSPRLLILRDFPCTPVYFDPPDY